MKSILFILLFISSSALTVRACYYYPYGDDIRFTLFNPKAVNVNGYATFHYSYTSFSPENTPTDFTSANESQLLNVLEWQKMLGTNVDPQSIFDVLYSTKSIEIKAHSSNPFIRYLFSKKKSKIIDYIRIMRKVGSLCNVNEDPWERNENANKNERNKLINVLLKKCHTNNLLRKRYAFLALKMCFYNFNNKLLQKIYRVHFANSTTKNIVDYWAMYYYAYFLPESVTRTKLMTTVFKKAKDKQFVAYLELKRDTLLKDSEIKPVILGLQNFNYNLQNLETLYKNKPNSPFLPILLYREICKVEDWLVTPYYTQFHTSLSEFWDSNDSRIRERIQEDQDYSKKLAAFISKLDRSKVKNNTLLDFSAAYLQMIFGNSKQALSILEQMETKNMRYDELKQLYQFKAICIVKASSFRSLTLPRWIENLILKESKRGQTKFVFAIARELEYQGNKTLAALLLSKITDDDRLYAEDPINPQEYVFWKSQNRAHTLFKDFYEDYFYYMDASYTSTEIKQLITTSQTKSVSNFQTWLFSECLKNKERLYDLLGTMYMREKQWKNALIAFKKVSAKSWNTWETKFYLKANPFYTNTYAQHHATNADTVHYTKAQIVEKLIDYEKKTKIGTNAQKSYYSILVANCLFNMSTYGNSWMMKRYYWTLDYQRTTYPDEQEYYTCSDAKKYYLQAEKLAPSKKIAALCLRMAGRCEKFNLMYQQEVKHKKIKDIFKANSYYKSLKTKYSEYYNELFSNCEVYDQYMKTNWK